MQDTLFKPSHEELAIRWMRRHPDVMAFLAEAALSAASRGKKFGMRLLWERARWECDVEWNADYKLNNNHMPYVADELIRRYPHLDKHIARRARGER